MSLRVAALALVAAPIVAPAQQPAPSAPAPPDTLAGAHQHGDSLTRRVFALAPVTITTTPTRREEPTSAVRIPQRVIQQAPATDAYDLLRQTAGVEVHEQGQGPGFASDASVRGFSSDHSTDLALWVDGVPNNEPVNGHAEGYNDWNLLFPQAIQDVEVLKGPTSALYGNFAMSGVVTVRTIERMRGMNVWLDPGSYGRAEGVLLGGFDHDTTAGVFGLRGVREDGWRPHSDYRLGQGHARLVRQLSTSTTLDAGVELYATGWNSPGYLTESHFTAGVYDIVANPTDGGFKRRAQERVSLRVLASSSLLWRTTVYATQGRWQLYLTSPPAGSANEGSGGQIEQEDRRYGLGLTSALTWALPRTEITVGTEGRWDHADFENWFTTNRVRIDTGQTVVAARQASAALFLQSTEDVTRHLRITLGGRVDGQDTHAAPLGGAATSHANAVFSPKFGALYHLSIPLDFYANVSRGFRQTDGVITDPTLPFITAWAYETGVKLDTRAVNGSLALFRMDVSNEQTVNPVPPFQATSGGASRRQGVEVELAARLTHGASLTTDWTFNDARYRQLITATQDTAHPVDTLSGARVFNTAKYVGTVALELAPVTAPWTLRASSDLVGPYSPFDEPGVVRPAYGLLHLGASVRIRQALISVGVRNVFNTAYRELEAGGFVSPGQPRSVYGRLRYTF
ncbi:MAG TPA: TonB-dependent receptor [Gemmatimonadales bacterium]|nr:TonB-dependent receptor [Gemmatimonadales bacterium]